MRIIVKGGGARSVGDSSVPESIQHATIDLVPLGCLHREGGLVSWGPLITL